MRLMASRTVCRRRAKNVRASLRWNPPEGSAYRTVQPLFWCVHTCQENRMCGDCLAPEQVGLLTQPSSCLLSKEEHLASPLYITLVDSCPLLFWIFPPKVLRTSPLGCQKNPKKKPGKDFFFNPLLNVASESQTCPTEWMTCLVNICWILLREWLFTEAQDFFWQRCVYDEVNHSYHWRMSTTCWTHSWTLRICYFFLHLPEPI